MHSYEIRVLSSEGKGARLFRATYASDFAAIRAAERIADGSDFEVWRGINCLYAKEKPVSVFCAQGPNLSAA